jgi:hypothetical protein
MDYTEAWKPQLYSMIDAILDEYGRNVSMEIIVKDKKTGSLRNFALMVDQGDDRGNIHAKLDYFISSISALSPENHELSIETP